MILRIGICLLALATVFSGMALPLPDRDKPGPKAVHSAQHLRYDSDVAQQPDNVINVDRIRALLRSGFTEVKIGNKTFSSQDSEKQPVVRTLPTAPTRGIVSTTHAPIPRTSPAANKSNEATSGENTSSEETVVTAKSKPTTSEAKKTETPSSRRSTTTEYSLITESDDENGSDEHTTISESLDETTRKHHSIAVSEETEEETDHLTTHEPQLQVLQEQYKRIQSAIIRNNSDDFPAPTSVPITTVPTATTVNFLAQLLRGFGVLAPQTTPPASRFETRGTKFQTKSSVETPEPTTTQPDPETEATTPLAETPTTTTEAPMPPPEPDYILASKQLSPFVSGVKSLDSGSTRDALDTASQMGKLTWLVNYYENSPLQESRSQS